MSKSAKSELLKRLAAGGVDTAVDSWKSLEANAPNHDQQANGDADDPRLSELLSRIQKLTDGDEDGMEAIQSPPRPDASPESPPATPAPRPSAPPRPAPVAPQSVPSVQAAPMEPTSLPSPEEGEFVPIEPATIEDSRFSEGEYENLILKYLAARAEATGRQICEQIKMPFRLIDPLMQSMKDDQLVGHKGASMINDYVYQITDMGRERARKLSALCAYFGAAPVALEDYIASVGRQSIAQKHPTEQDLQRAFADLLINKKMLRRLGPAVNSGRGMFLFGVPGNGKTSIAERLTKAFGDTVWIPRALGVDGEIMRMFDPSLHEEVPLEKGEGLIENGEVDKRWVRIKRPTIVVGGELTMDALEVTVNSSTNVSEAPVQLKSNTGTLVIDDFGRQRMTTDELLNRWIVPLEKRYDFLNLMSGKKIQVPFDQLIVFSTNLEPKDLVDDAFLRRIPYKIEVIDPTEGEFRELIKIMAPKLGVEYDQESVDYLIQEHYLEVKRPFRCCQPRDLLSQIRNFSLYLDKEPKMTRESFDFAVENYFAVM